MQPDPQTELLSIVAHDLKAPIGAVMGYIELIQQSGSLNEKQQRFAERALGGLKQMQHLVADLLDVAWIDNGAPLNLSACDLRSIIRDAVLMSEPLAAKRQVTIYVDVPSKLGLVMGDGGRLSQVMDNLLTNAIKYNREGGQVWVNARNEQNLVRVSISDSGIGISPEDLPFVFDRFFRSASGVRLKVEGSGLGLAIAKAIVEKHEGRIWVESEVDKGSIINFTIPRRAARVHEANPETEQHHASHESREYVHLDTHDHASEEMDAVEDHMQESLDLPSLDSSDDNL
jgi:two-component system, OmpR family, phosphate regulon sensor histidine kinase PhoR